jgi:hypothetical protein
MKPTTHIVPVLVLLACGVLANDPHGPFPAAAKVERVKLTEIAPQPQRIDADEQRSGEFLYLIPGAPGARLRVTHGSGSLFLDLTVGEQPAIPKSGFSQSSLVVAPTVYSADLNHDRVQDLVICSFSGGSGLASGFCNVAFILSSGGRYKLTTVATMNPDEDSFVVLGGTACFVQTSFHSVEKCKDGKPHNFWVHNLLAIRKNEIKVENRLHPEFPKTIWYTHKPNHRETTIVTREQKERMRDASLKKVYWAGEEQ